MSEILFARLDEVANADTLTTGTLRRPFSIVRSLTGAGLAVVPGSIIDVTDDMVVTASATDANGNYTPEFWGNVSSFVSNWTTGSAGTLTGARTPLLANLFFTHASSPSNTARFYSAGILTANIYTDDGGTLGSEKGIAYGLATVSYLKSTVKRWASLYGIEVDMIAEAGSAVLFKIGVASYSSGPTGANLGDAVQGSVIDAAFLAAAPGLSVGWKTAYGVGIWNAGDEPVGTTGTLFGTIGSFHAANAIDVSSAIISGFIFKSSQFNVTGAGAVSASMNAGVAASAVLAGSVIRAVGANANPARISVESYGTGVATAFSSFTARRANGTAAVPTAIQSGDLLFGFTGTGFGSTVFLPAAGAGITGWASQTFTDFVGGTELAVVVTPNGANANAESIRFLNGGNIKYTNAANFSANGAVATSLGSIGPTGSHTTVQKWLTIVDNTGATLYVPAF